MASHRQCFYCKQSFQSAQFHTHLKQCPQRRIKSQPGPLQQQQAPPYGGYQRPQYGGMGMQPQRPMGGGGGNGALWNCPQCSFQNAPNAAVCTLCHQGKRPMNMQQPQQGGHGGYGGGGGYGGYGQPQQPQQGGYGGGPQGGLPAPNQQGGGNDNNGGFWECQSCTFNNSIMSPSCKICSQPAPNKNNNNNQNNSNNKPPQPPQQQMYGNMPQQNKPPPPKPPVYGNNNNNNNGNNNNRNGGGMPPPPPMMEPKGNNNNGGGGGGGNIDPAMYGGGVAQEPDEATRLLIQQMMEAEMCVMCKKQQGFELPCSHNLCGPCAKKYILNGIATMKWKKQALVCPNPAGCNNDGVIPLWILKECGLGQGMQQKLEEMQNKYMIDSDPTITACPKCHETYSTESGDLSSVNANEKGPDGKPLRKIHIQHKAKYRFRCSKEACKTIFCSGCKAAPYHIGYTCDEYKQYKESKKCRFCEVSLNPSNTAPKDFTLKSGLDNVCNSADCLEKRRWSCDLKLQCGHNCIGLMGHQCIDCLDPKCLPKNAELTHEEFCNICWVDPLKAAPCVRLQCGHYFHFMCLWQKIDRKWPAARITFGFLNCPLCKKEIHHPALEDITKKYYDLMAEIQKDAVDRVKIEGLQHDKRLTDPNSPYYKNLEKFAMDRLAFYPCSKCKKPYFGGMKACEEAGLEQAENYKQEHLVCGSCASGPNAKSCRKHGKKYITYKCKFCCSVSSWYCWGSTHFCDSCHKRQEQGDYLNRKPISELPKCPGPDKCPLGVDHPANGTAEFSLGCVVCLRK